MNRHYFQNGISVIHFKLIVLPLGYMGSCKNSAFNLSALAVFMSLKSRTLFNRFAYQPFIDVCVFRLSASISAAKIHRPGLIELCLCLNEILFLSMNERSIHVNIYYS